MTAPTARARCLNDRCWSPTACEGFGYCREWNSKLAAIEQCLMQKHWDEASFLFRRAITAAEEAARAGERDMTPTMNGTLLQAICWRLCALREALEEVQTCADVAGARAVAENALGVDQANADAIRARSKEPT